MVHPGPSKSWAVVLPAHNSSLVIRNTIIELAEFFQLRSLTGQVVIVENGSSDDTWNVMNSIDGIELPFELIKLQSEKGLGNAIRKGLNSVSTEFVLITADDLPFGFSDLEGFLALSEPVDIAIGSKAHPLTEGTRSLIREVMSSVFRLLRKLILQLNIGDTQGSLLGKADVICKFSSRTKQGNYLFSTEILALASLEKITIIEIPVSFRRVIRKSNINLAKDSIRMIKGLFEVRHSLRWYR